MASSPDMAYDRSGRQAHRDEGGRTDASVNHLAGSHINHRILNHFHDQKDGKVQTEMVCALWVATFLLLYRSKFNDTFRFLSGRFFPTYPKWDDLSL